MTNNRELDKIVGDAIKGGSDFYRMFSSRFFGALIGETLVAEVHGNDSIKLEVLVGIAKQLYEEEKEKADTSGKVTA